MIDNNSIIVISNINFEYRDILIKRLLFRINRGIKPKLLIIIDDENNIPDSCYEVLNDLGFPLFVVKDIKSTPFLFMLKENVPNFNQFPFPYLVINRGSSVEVEEFKLAMDPELELIDNHMHTQLAYCSYNMDVEKAIKLGKILGLKSINFTEHSGQLYFNIKDYNKKDCFVTNIDPTVPSDHRVNQYLDFKKKYSSDFVNFGLELDFDFNGKPMMMENDLDRFDYILGAMHQLPEINSKEFLLQLEKMLKYGIDVFAHPFRIFKRNGKPLPAELFKPTAELLKQYNTAAEINFHTNQPPVEFIKECLSLGVKLSFGSDSHNLAEIGDFSYQLELLKEAGYYGDMHDILWVMDKVLTISK